MDQTLGVEKVGIWGEDVGLRSCKKEGGRWRDPRDSHWPCESLGALCKLQLFPGVWRYGQALLPHGSLVPGGLRPMQGVAGGPRARSRCPSSSPFCAPLRGARGGLLNRGVGEVGRLLLGFVNGHPGRAPPPSPEGEFPIKCSANR